MTSDETAEANKTKTIRAQVLRHTLSNIVGKVVTLGVWFFLTPFLLRQRPIGYVNRSGEATPSAAAESAIYPDEQKY